jgi:phage baseplate assembly protein W
MTYKNLVITPTEYNTGYTSTKNQFYKGFSTVDPMSNDVKLYDYDLIKQDLLNQFQVRKNERVMMPEFGTIIWDLLYDPFTDDTKAKIAEDVRRIVTSDPRAECTEINIIQQDYGMLLEVTLLYVGTDKSNVLRLNFDKEVGLNIVSQ